MVLSDFTRFEIEYIRENANFTEQEEILFDMRCVKTPIDEIAEILNLSTDYTAHLSQKVNMKIKKVLSHKNSF